MDNIRLIGAEDVLTAARTMRSAAEIMDNAARNIVASHEDHQRFLTQWLYDLQQTMENNKL